MKAKYDKLGRFETPMLFLCDPGSALRSDDSPSRVVGVICNTSDEEAVLNFNELSELNFRAYLPEDDGSANTDAMSKTIDVYKKLKCRRLIYATGLGYFVISESNIEYDNGLRFKDVKALSAESELQDKTVPYLGKTVGSGDSEVISYTYTIEEIVDIVTGLFPQWSCNKNTDIDNSLKSLYRTFEDIGDETNVLSFLMSNVQDAFECIIEFDTFYRKIIIHDRNTYVNATNIHLTEDDLLKSVTIQEDAENVYTALRVFGSEEDVTIHLVNPLGGGVIYRFDYYLDRMTPTLRAKVESWQQAIASSETSYYNEGLAYHNAMAGVSTQTMEVSRLKGLKELYERLYENIATYTDSNAVATDSIVAQYNAAIESNGGEAINIDRTGATDISQWAEALQAEVLGIIGDSRSGLVKDIDSAESTLSLYESQAATRKATLDDIVNGLSFETYFTSGELTELSYYIYEGKYTDEYIVVTDSMSAEGEFECYKTLYDRAKKQLEKISEPTLEFSVDSENFIFEQRFADWTDQLENGCTVTVDIPDSDITSLLLSSISVNYDDRDLNLTFGNRLNKFDTKSLYDNALGKINRTTNTVSYISEAVTPLRNGEFDRVKEELQTSRNLSMDKALASTDQEVIIDASGYTGRAIDEDGMIKGEQIKIVNNQIVFTDDGWKNCALALGSIIYVDENKQPHTVYGVNAGALISDIVMTQTLKVRNENSSITLGKDGAAFQGQGLVNSSYVGTNTNIDLRGVSISHGDIEVVDTELLYDGHVYATPSSDKSSLPYYFDFEESGSTLSGNRYKFSMDDSLSYISDDKDIVWKLSGQTYVQRQKLYITKKAAEMQVSSIDDMSYSIIYWGLNASVSAASVGGRVKLSISRGSDDWYIIMYGVLNRSILPLEIISNTTLTGKKVYIYGDPEEYASHKESIFDKISNAISAVIQLFVNALNRKRSTAREIVEQKFYDTGFHITNANTNDKMALLADEIIFANEGHNVYSVYGKDGMQTTTVGANSIVADDIYVSGGMVNLDVVTVGGAAGAIDLLGGCHSLISSGDNLNTYTTPGVYGVSSNSIAAGLTNCPSDKAGVLIVRDLNGCATQGSTWLNKYLIQEYRRIDDKRRYSRRATTTDGGSTWSFTSWELNDRVQSIDTFVPAGTSAKGWYWRTWGDSVEVFVKGNALVSSATASGSIFKSNVCEVDVPTGLSLPDDSIVVGTSSDPNLYILNAKISNNKLTFYFGSSSAFTGQSYAPGYNFHILSF